MHELRIYGRGGQGAVLASKIPAHVLVDERQHGTAMPALGTPYEQLVAQREASLDDLTFEVEAADTPADRRDERADQLRPDIESIIGVPRSEGEGRAHALRRNLQWSQAPVSHRALAGVGPDCESEAVADGQTVTMTMFLEATC